MKAALFHEHGSVDVLKVEDVPKPEISPNEVLINVKAFSLNHLDIWVRNGLPNLKLKFPHIGGSDFAGVIAKVGDNVSDFHVGDRVVANAGISCRNCENCNSGEQSLCEKFYLLGEHTNGGAAEFAKIPQTNILLIPDDISFGIAAAAALTSLTSYRMLVTKGNIKPGEFVLVIGAGGGIGTIAVQIASYFGGRVIALTSKTEQAEKFKELGAEYVINYKTDENWANTVWEYTEKKGVHIVIDSVGEIVWKSAIRCLRKGGKLVTCGATSGRTGEVNISLLFWKQISLLGSTMSNDQEFREAMNLVFQKKIKPVIDSTYDINEIKRAHQRLESGLQLGKIVITI